MTDEESFLAVENKWKKKIENLSREPKRNRVILLVGTKVDGTRVVEKERAKKYAFDNEMAYLL